MDTRNISAIYRVNKKKLKINPNTKIEAYIQLFFVLFKDMVIQNCSRYYISFYTAFFFEYGADLKHAKKLVDYGFVRSATVQKAARALNDSTIPVNHKLEYLFMIGFEFAGHVLNNYWLLKPNLTKKIDDLAHRTNFNSYYMIGLQLRNYYLAWNQTEIDVFIDCALSIEDEKRPILGDQLVKWYVISDEPKLLDLLVAKYKDKIIVGEGLIGHVGEDSPESYVRALMDLELMSRCNETVLTGSSTFGFLASLKNQKRPYVVDAGHNLVSCRRFEFFAPDAIF